MKRSTFVAASAAFVLAPQLARADGPIRVMTLPIDQGAQCFYAQDLGMFKKAGLDAQVSTTNFGTQVASDLLRDYQERSDPRPGVLREFARER